jgi:hypothetical protein
LKTPERIKLHPKIIIIQEGLDGGAYQVNMNYGKLMIIASFGGGWDHVSVSYKNRCPTWDETCLVKDIFFDKDEAVVQYHPAEKDYINKHPYCLHLWKPQEQEILMPPKWMVG